MIPVTDFIYYYQSGYTYDGAFLFRMVRTRFLYTSTCPTLVSCVLRVAAMTKQIRVSYFIFRITF